MQIHLSVLMLNELFVLNMSLNNENLYFFSCKQIIEG